MTSSFEPPIERGLDAMLIVSHQFADGSKRGGLGG
jgi:hypothetical protein